MTNKLQLALAGLVSLLVVGLLSIVAVKVSNPPPVQVTVNVPNQKEPLGVTFTSPGSNFTDIAVANDLTVGDELTVTATSSLGYMPNGWSRKSSGLVDTTSTMASICNSEGQPWYLRGWGLLVPSSGAVGAGSPEAGGTRQITVGTTTGAGMASTTDPKSFGLAALTSYTTSSVRQFIYMDFATSTPVLSANYGNLQTVQNGECLNVAINRPASSTRATNVDGRFWLDYIKWPPSS